MWGNRLCEYGWRETTKRPTINNQTWWKRMSIYKDGKRREDDSGRGLVGIDKCLALMGLEEFCWSLEVEYIVE